MRSYNVGGVLQRVRRAISSVSNVYDNDVANPARLSDTIRKLSARVTELEAVRTREGVEITRNVTGTPAGPVNYSFTHGLGSRVRWYPVHYESVSNNPMLFVWVSDGPDLNSTVLKAYCTGKIIMRFEPTDYTYG